MAKITRKLLKVFGSGGSTTNFGVFGSARAGSPAKSMDVETIQSLAAWTTEGWVDAVNASNKAPFIEDMNAAMYVMAYQLGYILQDGIPDWNALTTYYIGSVVRKTGTAELYQSAVDTNLNQALGAKVTNSKWVYLVDLADVVPTSFITTARIAADAVDKDKINADVAGNGLGQNADGSLEVKVDDSTVELSGDALRVKGGGIVESKLATGAVTNGKIGASAVTYQKATGLMDSSGWATAAIIDGSQHTVTKDCYIMYTQRSDSSLWADIAASVSDGTTEKEVAHISVPNLCYGSFILFVPKGWKYRITETNAFLSSANIIYLGS